MSEIIKIHESFLEKLREQAAKRDQIAQEMGAARFFYLQSERDALIKIERAMKEQASIGNVALKMLGIDPEAGTYNIDLSTGEVKHVL